MLKRFALQTTVKNCLSTFHLYQIAADAKKKADEPKFDDKADPSAGLMNVSDDGIKFNKIVEY